MIKTKLRNIVITLLLALPSLIVKGQTDSIVLSTDTNYLNYREYFESITNLDNSRIPTGYLYDKVYPIAGLKEVVPFDSIESSDLFQAWWELENSKFGGNENSVYDSLRHDCYINNLSHHIPILTIDFDFASIDTNAIIDGRLILDDDSILVDAQGASPYITHHVGLTGLSTGELVAGVDNKLYFTTQHLLSNTEAEIEYIKITRPGETPILIYPNEEYVFNTEITGTELWNIEVELVGNAPNPSNKQLVRIIPNVHSSRSACEDGVLWIIESDIPFKGYQESKATTSIADAHIYYHKAGGTPEQDCKLIRPIIIVDGFDPMDEDRDFEKILEKMNYNNNDDNLVSELQNMGFDVIILNFPVLGSPAIQYKSEVKQYRSNGTFQRYVNLIGRDGGADYIERNAFLVVKLIQEVNAELQLNGSGEELVVVGPSMGGLVTRYALAYMEEKHQSGVPNMDHNTRLWISFDAPHKGANISLGTQLTLDYFGNHIENQELIEKFNKKLRSVAARQMLIKQYDAKWNENNYQSRYFHRTFVKSLKNNGLDGAKGYPQNLRKVSLLNGPINGNNSFIPGDYDVWITAEICDIEVFKLISRFEADYGGTSKVFEGKAFSLKNKILNPFAPEDIVLQNDFIHGSMDAVQGSYYTDPEGVSEGVKEGLKDFHIKKENIKVNYDNLNFTFIPSFSALDIKDFGNLHWNTDMSNQNLSCNNLTPFDNYFVPDEIQEHIFLTAENVAWVKQEVLKGHSDCKVCAKMEDWPNKICRGTTENYEIRNLPNFPHSITWTVDNPKLSVQNGQGSEIVTIAAATGTV